MLKDCLDWIIVTPTTIKFKVKYFLRMFSTVISAFAPSDTGVHIERVFRDEEFWSDCVIKAQRFFKKFYSARKVVYKTMQ